jgi:hypothetical protein
VEGETDRDYFKLADDLYFELYGRRLLGDELAVFPTGSGDQGGTYGICEHFPLFRKLIDLDLTPDGRPLFRAIALVDGDSPGKNASRILTSKHVRLMECRDVFVLQREFPRNTIEPNSLKTQIKNANQSWRQLDCEIEDLLSETLLELYLETQPNSIFKQPMRLNGEHHFFFHNESKRDLFRFVEGNAQYEDLRRIIEVLRSMRYYLGIDPDGG